MVAAALGFYGDKQPLGNRVGRPNSPGQMFR